MSASNTPITNTKQELNETNVSQITSHTTTPNSISEYMTEKGTEPIITSVNNSVTDTFSFTVPKNNYTESPAINTTLTSIIPDFSSNTDSNVADVHILEDSVLTTLLIPNNLSSSTSNANLVESVIYGRPTTTTKQPVVTNASKLSTIPSTYPITISRPLTSPSTTATPSSTTVTSTTTSTTTSSTTTTTSKPSITLSSTTMSAKPSKKPVISAKAGMKI